MLKEELVAALAQKYAEQNNPQRKREGLAARQAWYYMGEARIAVDMFWPLVLAMEQVCCFAMQKSDDCQCVRCKSLNELSND